MKKTFSIMYLSRDDLSGLVGLTDKEIQNLPDYVMEDIALNIGDILFDGEAYRNAIIEYFATNMDTCWHCNKYLIEEEQIINVFDEHTYCHKCNNKIARQYEKAGWKYDYKTDSVISPERK